MTANSHSLAGQVAIITGAGKGLGRAWALHLASLGARLVVNNRGSQNQPGGSSADAVVAEIRAAGGQAVANYDSVEAPDTGPCLVEAALTHFGQLDIVLANAGIDRSSSFRKQAMAEFEEVFAVNFFAVARLLHAAWPQLYQRQFGRVLVATSTAGLYGNHGQAAYASSKAALLGLVKTLAIEGASRNVRVNAIAPYAATQMTRGAFPAEQAGQFSPAATAKLVGWLVSEPCELTGTTMIAGAGHARLARTLESDTVSLNGDVSAAIRALVDMPCRFAPRSASGEFEEFKRSL